MKSSSHIKLALRSEHMEPLYAYVAAKGDECPVLKFPTVYMEDDDGTIRGVVGTADVEDVLSCGKAIADDPLRFFELLSAYESTLRDLGAVMYVAPIYRNSPLVKYATRLGFERYHEDDKHIFFRRYLQKAA
jgi:hypothetical protein